MRILFLLTGALLLSVYLAPIEASAQVPISGRVLDAETANPLPGVHVMAEGTTRGAVTDRDGYFVLNLDVPPRRIVCSCMGYETVAVEPAHHEQPMIIYLQSREMDMHPVVVSASRVEERRSETPVAISSITAHELQNRRPDQLAEVLSALPGVQMTPLGNEQHVMSIRQPISHGALYAYLEDGVPIRPTGIFNHNALIEVNMAGVSRVEVVRGPGSALFGPNAIGGSVNFITPQASTRPEIGLQVRTDDRGYRRGDVNLSTPLGRGGVWGGGYVARQRDGWAAHSDFDKVSLSVRGDYPLSSTTRITTTVSANRLVTDTNGNLDSLSFFARDFTSLQTFTNRRVNATRAMTRLNHAWSGRQSTEVTAFWRHNEVEQIPHFRIRNDRSDPLRARGERNRDAFRSLGISGLHRLYLSPLSIRLITGGSFEQSPNSYHATFLDIEREAGTGRYVEYSDSDSTLTNYDVDLRASGAFAQLELSPVERVKLVGSLRYDWIQYDFDNHLPPSSFTGAPDAVDTFRSLSPRAGVTVDLGSTRGLYANISRGFLPPEINELYRGVKVPHLRPAIYRSVEVGGWTALADGRVYIDLSAYHMTGRDEIVSVLLEDGSTENRNAGRTRHAGIEYALVARPVEGVSVRFTGTNAIHRYLRFQDAGASFDGNDMNAAPDWMAHAELTFQPRFANGLRLSIEWEHLGSYYMDALNSAMYDGYDLFGVRTAYRRGPVELWFNVHNLTDAHYAVLASKRGTAHAYTPGAPRRIGVGIGYNL